MADTGDFDFSASLGQQKDLQPTAAEPSGVIAPTSTAPVLSPTSQQTFSQAMTYGLPGIGVGLLDTIGQSLGVLHNDSIPNFMKNFTGDGEGTFGDFYARNQPALRTGGEVAGMFLPGLAAMKVLKSVNGLREAGSIGSLLKNSTAMDYLMGSAADLHGAELEAAAQSARAEQAFSAGRTLTTPAIKAAQQSYTAARAVHAVTQTIAFELGNYAAFNSSQTFYPADFTYADQAKWYGSSLGVGVGLEMIATRFAMRNMVQSAVKAFEGNAKEYGTLVPTTAGSDLQKASDQVMFRPGARGIGVTQKAAEINALDDMSKAQGQTPAFQTNVAQNQVNNKAAIVKQLNMMAYDNNPFITRATLQDGNSAKGIPSQADIALKALKDNPTALLYSTKLAQIPTEGAGDFYTSISDGLAKARDDYNKEIFLASTQKDFDEVAATQTAFAKLKPIEDAAAETHYILEPTGGWTVYRNRADNFLDTNNFDAFKRKNYLEPNPAATGDQSPNIKAFKLQFKGDNDVALHYNFVAELPKTPTPTDISALYAGASKLIKEYKPIEGAQFILTPEVNWRTQEMVVGLADQNKNAQSAIKLGGDYSSLDDARFNILDQKIQGLMADMPDVSRAPVQGLRARFAGTAALTPAQVFAKYNLPMGDGLTSNPIAEMAAHMKLQGMTSLNEMFPKPTGLTPGYSQWDLVTKHLQETVGTDQPIQTQGKLLQQGFLDNGGNVVNVKPIFVAGRSTPQLKYSDAQIAANVQALRDIQLERLGQIDPTQSPLVSGVLNKIVSQSKPVARQDLDNNEFWTGVNEGGNLSNVANTARTVQTLQDGVVSGTGQVVYQDRINEQFPALKAMQLLAQDGDKFVDSYVTQLSQKNGLISKIGQLVAPKNKADLVDFNRIEQAYRHGWDIKGIIPLGNQSKFVLNLESKVNKELAAYHFPNEDFDEVGIPQYLPDMSVTAKKQGYTPLTVSSSAASTAQTISKMSKQSGRENNALRVALGYNPIKIRDFHLPTPELSKDGTFFVRNSTGRVIATYSGANLNENRKRAQDAAEVLNKTTADKQHVAVPLDTVAAEHQVNDEHFFDLIDYSDQLAKSGVGIKGGLAHTEIDTSDLTLRSMAKSLQQQFLNIGIRSRAAIFEPELNYARQASEAATAQGANKNLGGINIFDRYIATAFSRNPTNQGKDGWIKRIYGGIETGLDKALTVANANYAELSDDKNTSALGKALRTIVRKQTAPEEFAAYEKVMPKWSPFEDAADWAESTFKQKPQWSTRPIAAQLSRLSATMSLRFLDLGTVVNNLAGLVTNTPAVVYGLRQLPGEGRDAWLARTGAFSSEIKSGIATFSPMKAMNTSIKALWNGELNEPMAEAAKHGYFDPEYASLAKALTTPSSPSMEKLHKWAGYATYLADKSEILSRQIGWGMGYKIGKDLHGFKDENDAYIFANNFVNELIGNYSPNNKPAMFSGAIGLPLGAFQTYMFNFYRRMYGYVERGDKASLIAQYAAQASVFGARSVPGYAAWNSIFQSNQSGSDDFTSRIERRMSPGVSELLLNGSLSNIPKIFGSSDGLAFYSRGSVDFTQPPPNLLDMSKAPPIQFLADTYAGISKTVDNIMSSSGFSLQQQEEIMAQFSTNRALKSIMELASNDITTRQGDTIQTGTRDAIHVAAAILGTKPSSVMSQKEAMNRQRIIQLQQEDLRSKLTDHTQAIFRSGKITVEQLQGTVKDYLNAGGNPAYLGQWFRNTFATAQTPQTQKALESLAHQGKFLEFQDMLATIQQNEPSNIKGKPNAVGR